MSSWIKALNPLDAPTTEPEARQKARASAVALVISAVHGAIGVALLAANMETMRAAMVEAAAAQSAGQPAESAEMVQSMVGGAADAMPWIAGAIVVIQLGLAFWQWAKPNIVIPIIFLLLTAYGLLGSLGTVQLGMDASVSASSPLWNLILGIIVMVLGAVFHISGIRGAAALGKYKIRD
ncbi:hypothetical protein JIP62_04740 [Brevundimonas vitis]|uniref:Uncharacterized protein n=1 Tax=Brevundimonas vitisensis TaxID=2800818 RepID=A0ABX7BQ81_9CAUL|nr:hypothetical protein [Brevundimonas vitisensis]QQQ19412.1 hypothetical protein JIP62_04740 [Brevundimonas vitisensis]